MCVCVYTYIHDSKIDLTMKGLRIANISIRKKEKKNIYYQIQYLLKIFINQDGDFVQNGGMGFIKINIKVKQRSKTNPCIYGQ